MSTKVDMTYRFLWDEEPTEEQLEALMQEVAEDFRRENAELAKQVIRNIEEAHKKAVLLLNESEGK